MANMILICIYQWNGVFNIKFVAFYLFEIPITRVNKQNYSKNYLFHLINFYLDIYFLTSLLQYLPIMSNSIFT